MKILEHRALRGANYYSRHPVIFMKLDLEELEFKPTDQVPEFRSMLDHLIPTLYDHKCSPGHVGGFYERLDQGTWAGHVVEHVAIELQCLAGDEVAFGKTYTTEPPGIYHLVYRYRDEAVGLRAGELAVAVVEAVYAGRSLEVTPLVEELKAIGRSRRLGPSTQSIVDEAVRRGIPWRRLNESSWVQLGQGRFQRKIEATMMDDTSAMAVEIADDKEETKRILSSMGIPVPQGISVESYEEALAAAETIGYPVVVKPLVGNHGRGITLNVTRAEELRTALETAAAVYSTCLVERYLEGFDYRVLVINGRFVAAAHREPAFVIGNGRNTVKELIDEVNRDPERGDGHESNLTRITVDPITERILALQKLDLHTVLETDRKVYVKAAANLSAGGTATDVTDTVHPANKLMAERIARLIGLNVMGIDIVAPTLETPLEWGVAGVVEVNAAPGFRMHLHPTQGTPRNIAAHILDMLFPPGTEHSIPICAVTGTNGKTTTTRLISHILKGVGHTVGLTTTDAVFVGDTPILKGDYSGPEGAATLLRDPTVDAAVLEVARGGILRRGLGYEQADVGVLLNISHDHLGEGGIDTLEELTRLKSTVTETVAPSGHAVFNADDLRVLSCVRRTKARTVLFSKDWRHPALRRNLESGPFNVTVKGDHIIIQRANEDVVVARIQEIPATFGGKAVFNIENVLAAVAATTALGISSADIRRGLLGFSPSIDHSPGRMNLINLGDIKVLVDYSHNIGSIRATAGFIRSLMPGRIIRMSSGVGNRRDQDIIAFGRALALTCDHVVLCDPDRRGRLPGETPQLIKQGLLEGGFTECQVHLAEEEQDATRLALEQAVPGDLVVLQADDIAQVIRDVLDFKANRPLAEAADGSSLAM